MKNHFERKFILSENQVIWDTYFKCNLEDWIEENKETLKSQEWTDDEKIKEEKRMLAYNMPLDKVTPYNIGYIRKKQSIQQYKPIIIQFEDFIKKSFNEITNKDIEIFSMITEKKNKLPHLNAFLLYCVSNGIIKNRDKDFLISLLPEIYRELGKIIAE